MSELTPLQIRQLKKGDKLFIKSSSCTSGRWVKVESAGRKFIKLPHIIFCAVTGVEIKDRGSNTQVYFTEESYKNSAKNSRYIDAVRKAVRRGLDTITLGQAHQLVKLFNLDIELHND